MEDTPADSTRHTLVTVYRTPNANAAHLLKALLADYGIAACVSGDASVIASTELGLRSGSITVTVSGSDAVIATGIAAAFDRHLHAPAETGDPMDETPQLWAEWPTCQGCHEPRPTQCPVCQTTGSQFDLGDPGPENATAPVTLLCPICDEPFHPEFYRTCGQCGHEHHDGKPFDESVLVEHGNERAVMVGVGLVATFVAGLLYLLYTFRVGG